MSQFGSSSWREDKVRASERQSKSKDQSGFAFNHASTFACHLAQSSPASSSRRNDSVSFASDALGWGGLRATSRSAGSLRLFGRFNASRNRISRTSGGNSALPRSPAKGA